VVGDFSGQGEGEGEGEGRRALGRAYEIRVLEQNPRREIEVRVSQQPGASSQPCCRSGVERRWMWNCGMMAACWCFCWCLSAPATQCGEGFIYSTGRRCATVPSRQKGDWVRNGLVRSKARCEFED
jgi:hypothetical protein